MSLLAMETHAQTLDRLEKDCSYHLNFAFNFCQRGLAFCWFVTFKK